MPTDPDSRLVTFRTVHLRTSLSLTQLHEWRQTGRLESIWHADTWKTTPAALRACLIAAAERPTTWPTIAALGRYLTDRTDLAELLTAQPTGRLEPSDR